MTAKDLERLYDYGYWANSRLLKVVAQLTPEQFTQNVAGGYGSIRNSAGSLSRRLCANSCAA